MQVEHAQAKLLAQALYEIRNLLSGYLGSTNEGPIVVREAAHLSYALHNEALAIIEGRAFDPKKAMPKLQYVDRVFGGTYAERFADHIDDGTSNA